MSLSSFAMSALTALSGNNLAGALASGSPLTLPLKSKIATKIQLNISEIEGKIQIIKTMENKDFLPDRYKNL
ncbi:MAG: hypothetical protein KH812_09840 [Proteus hauseri]|nr:hypothetical protein [Proteus hauseri]